MHQRSEFIRSCQQHTDFLLSQPTLAQALYTATTADTAAAQAAWLEQVRRKREQTQQRQLTVQQAYFVQHYTRDFASQLGHTCPKLFSWDIPKSFWDVPKFCWDIPSDVMGCPKFFLGHYWLHGSGFDGRFSFNCKQSSRTTISLTQASPFTTAYEPKRDNSIRQRTLPSQGSSN